MKGEYITQLIFVMSPVAIVSFFSFAKCCVKHYARYKELKLLKDSGAKHVVIAKDHISFK